MLAKSKLHSTEILISNALIDSNISHNEMVLISNIYDRMKKKKKKIQRLNQLIEDSNLLMKQCCHIDWSVE